MGGGLTLFDHTSVTFAGNRNASGLTLAICSLAAFVVTVFSIKALKIWQKIATVLTVFIVSHELHLLPGKKRNEAKPT